MLQNKCIARGISHPHLQQTSSIIQALTSLKKQLTRQYDTHYSKCTYRHTIHIFQIPSLLLKFPKSAERARYRLYHQKAALLFSRSLHNSPYTLQEQKHLVSSKPRESFRDSFPPFRSRILILNYSRNISFAHHCSSSIADRIVRREGIST